MKKGLVYSLGGLAVAALLLLALGRRHRARQQRWRDADDLKRWEDEGGPAPPDTGEADHGLA
jgi:hypothetical protein